MRLPSIVRSRLAVFEPPIARPAVSGCSLALTDRLCQEIAPFAPTLYSVLFGRPPCPRIKGGGPAGSPAARETLADSCRICGFLWVVIIWFVSDRWAKSGASPRSIKPAIRGMPAWCCGLRAGSSSARCYPPRATSRRRCGQTARSFAASPWKTNWCRSGWKRNRQAAFDACTTRLRDLDLPTTLMEVEHLFDGQSLVLLFPRRDHGRSRSIDGRVGRTVRRPGAISQVHRDGHRGLWPRLRHGECQRRRLHDLRHRLCRRRCLFDPQRITTRRAHRFRPLP